MSSVSSVKKQRADILTKLKAKVYILLQPDNFEGEQKMRHLFFDICYYLQKE